MALTRSFGVLLLLLALLCQGATARIHIAAPMSGPLQLATTVEPMSCHGDQQHNLPLASLSHSDVDQHGQGHYCSDDNCAGECGQCQVISVVAALFAEQASFPYFHGPRARASLPDFTSVTLFPDSPPPLA